MFFIPNKLVVIRKLETMINRLGVCGKRYLPRIHRASAPEDTGETGEIRPAALGAPHDRVFAPYARECAAYHAHTINNPWGLTGRTRTLCRKWDHGRGLLSPLGGARFRSSLLIGQGRLRHKGDPFLSALGLLGAPSLAVDSVHESARSAPPLCGTPGRPDAVHCRLPCPCCRT